MSAVAAPHGFRNRRVAIACMSLAAGMGVMAYAAVPLYDLLCRVTGLNGTTQVASAAPAKRGERQVEVRFDSNVAPGLPWTFRAEVNSVTVTLGETRTVSYAIRNVAARATTGIASFNVSPPQAGAYFSKIQCFCFTEQTLAAGEAREETVVFFVDPAIETDPALKNLPAITLSYTFMAAKPQPRQAASNSTASGKI